MHLGRIGYYADFIIYPVVVFVCASVMLSRAGQQQRLLWCLAVGFGLLLWTLLEYLTHRFVLHRVAWFRRLHDRHHQAPAAKIGTPAWATAAIALLGIFLPACLMLGVFLGSGVTAGFLIGYIWYSCVHHAAHHWRPRHGSYLYCAKRRHARHHHVDGDGDYGVTTTFWDWVFEGPSRLRG